APSANGGQFAQQPKVNAVDEFGNICTSDNGTIITASKKDSGTWNLTGTTTAAVSAGVATFTDLGATNQAQVDNAQLAFNSGSLTEITSTAVTLPAPQGAYTAAATAATTEPTAGTGNTITLTVKDKLGNTDTNYDGNKSVTLTGYEAAPDTTYGSFGGITLEADGSTDVTVTFTDGVGTADLILNKADVQTIGL
ncbi:hypothetical protein, partial [Vallitalea maricola]|uniref:hypothetical protein n=1 Tax=Vallitalea maricola TaxID=3074433 RepID=UPI0030DACEFE